MYKIIYYMNENKNITQRELATKVNLSLGKVNNLIKKCIEEGYIQKTYNYKEKVQYIVTEKGFNYLKTNVGQVGKEKIKINIDDEYKINTAVILAAGERKEFNSSIAALDIEGQSIIKRMINILKENGIKFINIVVGYKKDELIESLKDESNINFIINDKYKWTGSMMSLYCAKEYIKDDFILIEGDIVIESNAITSLMNTNCRDGLLITNESGSGDEGFVQIKDGCLFKLGKDIHQFNRIDGEMIGISKISYKLFNLMLEEYSDNINPYLNYEYILLDVSRNYKVPCIKIDNLAWGEVDSLDQYNKIINIIYPRIRRKEIKTRKDKIESIIIECLKLDYCDIKEVVRIGGMTNKNYKVSFNNETVILRLPGIGTDKMINRNNEIKNAKLVGELGIDSEILYIDEISGIKISRYIENAETLTGRSCKKEENMKKVANILRKLHNSDIVMKNEFNVFKEINNYEKIIKDNKYEFYNGYFDIREKVKNIENLMKKYGVNNVPSHNDTLPDNFIIDENDRMYLIDWEYSGLNDEMWDIAAHSLESDFSKNDEELLLKYYFNGDISHDNKIKLLMNKILQDILWSLWTIIKENEGESYGSYGIDRYNRGIENLEKLYDLI
ncbi:phosphocholine cytidylyltransferase/choline kinase family protein [Clostridium baratii]|uniref:phosphocholine cytidylyltransferase/choline kinase family protein n=1 Tax=Clostridium baratii TaxID=1561 RepID=UPI0030D21CCC